MVRVPDGDTWPDGSTVHPDAKTSNPHAARTSGAPLSTKGTSPTAIW
jgi:hypothetical protein